jgi:hypothetical protein
MWRATLILVGGVLGLAPRAGRQMVWQADLRIRTFEVSEVKGSLTARVVVVSEFGVASAVRLELLLPVGVGLLELSPGCTAGPSPKGVSALRARVTCLLGDVPLHVSRELHVTTTTPPPGMAHGFGVIAISDTPDPRPGNNFAEKAIPER